MNRLRLRSADWSKYAARCLPPRALTVTVIDEAHTIVTGSYTCDAINAFKGLAKVVRGTPYHMGHPNAGYNFACGSCPRSMKCLRGQTPTVICPQCRRTEHDYNAPFAHLFRKDPSGYRLIDNFGQSVAEKFDYVPSSCPLWITQERYIVDKEPCPLCKAKAKVTTIHVQYANPRHRRLLIRLRKPKRPKPNDTMRTFLERRYDARLKQTMQRPPHRFTARSLQQR